MVPSQERAKQAGSTSIAKLSPNVDENKLGLSCRGLGVGGMEGGGNTYIYRTALYGSFPSRTENMVLPGKVP